MKTSVTTASDEAVMRALSPAEVTVVVGKFKDIFTATGRARTRSTPHRITMSKPHSQVRIDPNNPETLLIKPRGATLRFTIRPKEFFPIGLAFHLKEGVATPDDATRLGLLNFDQMKIRPDDNSLSVTDEFKDCDADDRYKFSIIIQRGSDGQIGIIDPGIRHEPH